MKDKPKMQTTMQDIARKEFSDGKGDNQFLLVPELTKKKDNIRPIKSKKVSAIKDTDNYQIRMKEEQAKINAYNEIIRTLDKDYTSFVPFKQLLVRAFAKNYTKISKQLDLIEKPKVKVAVPTQNGIGTLEMAESPWAFDNKVIVVSTPDKCPFKPGDILQVHEACVLAAKRSREHEFELPHGFILAGRGNRFPTTMDDKDYGYLLIDYYNFVQGTLESAE